MQKNCNKKNAEQSINDKENYYNFMKKNSLRCSNKAKCFSSKMFIEHDGDFV